MVIPLFRNKLTITQSPGYAVLTLLSVLPLKGIKACSQLSKRYSVSLYSQKTTEHSIKLRCDHSVRWTYLWMEDGKRNRPRERALFVELRRRDLSQLDPQEAIGSPRSKSDHEPQFLQLEDEI